MPEVTPLPARTRGHVTLASFANFHKLNAESFEPWLEILRAVQGARLIVLGAPDAESGERLKAYFTSRGVAADRVEVRPQQRYGDYLRTFAEADIALDTFPY